MRVMFKRFIPLMLVFIVIIIICAEPFTRIFYRFNTVLYEQYYYGRKTRR